MWILCRMIECSPLMRKILRLASVRSFALSLASVWTTGPDSLEAGGVFVGSESPAASGNPGVRFSPLRWSSSPYHDLSRSAVSLRTYAPGEGAGRA